ncbi:MAG: hypothetical protein QOJ16_466 [Acidobacteriota bacterium]|nr:hypothetical protein [Acidobacteriota bacterium]
MRSVDRFLLGMVLILLLAQAAGATTPPNPPAGAGGAASTAGDPAAPPAPAPTAQVSKVTHWPKDVESGDAFKLGDRLTVTVENLSALVKDQMKCKTQLALYLNGLRLEGLQPVCDLANGTLTFPIERGDSTTAKIWSDVLGGSSGPAQVHVSVGLKDSDPVKSDKSASFQVYRPDWRGYIPALILLLLVLVLFRGGLLRDSVPDETNVKKRPYSLSRFQFAGWLVLLVGAYCLVWISTGEIPVLTQQLLALLGVTAGTVVGGSAINSAMTDKRMAGAAAPGAQTTPQHRNFVFDILSEDGALSVARLQHAVWTLVLWVLFCISVYRVFGVLDFDKTLLGLMGISALAYGATKPAEGSKG